MMAIIMGAKDTATLNRACDLGIAFQLTNISRDVIDDAAEGRIYLPADWLNEEGVDCDGISDPLHREALYRVVARVLDTADDYYASARHGLTALPFRSALGNRCRPQGLPRYRYGRATAGIACLGQPRGRHPAPETGKRGACPE